MKVVSSNGTIDKRAYITLIGRHSWAVINSFYAIIKHDNFIPQKIHVIVERLFESNFNKIKQALTIILNEYGGTKPEIIPHVVEELDFISSKNISSDIIKDLHENRYEVGINLTSGRKPIISGLLYSLKDIAPANNDIIVRLYYLSIKKVDGSNKPYEMIPNHLQKLTNFLKSEASTE